MKDYINTEVETGRGLVEKYIDGVVKQALGTPHGIKKGEFTKWLKQSLTKAYNKGREQGYEEGNIAGCKASIEAVQDLIENQL